MLSFQPSVIHFKLVTSQALEGIYLLYFKQINLLSFVMVTLGGCHVGSRSFSLRLCIIPNEVIRLEFLTCGKQVYFVPITAVISVSHCTGALPVLPCVVFARPL